jgi:hypothetical protein
VVPSGTPVPACVREAKRMRQQAWSTKLHPCSAALSLSLLIPVGCARSAAASRANSSMRVVGVCGQARSVVAAPDGSGHDNFPPQACTVKSEPSSRGTGKEHVRTLRGKVGHRVGSRSGASERTASPSFKKTIYMNSFFEKRKKTNNYSSGPHIRSISVEIS